MSGAGRAGPRGLRAVSGGWAAVPGLGASLGARADQVLLEIAAALRRPPPPIDGDRKALTALLVREPGFALFYAYLDRARPRAPYRHLAERFMDRAIACVPAMSHKPFYSHGFSGTAWAAEHLGGGWILPRDPGGNDEVDDALLHLVEQAPGLAASLQYGMVGFGIYALERLPGRAGRRLLERIVVRLGREAVAARGGLCWRDRPYWHVRPGADEMADEGAALPGVFGGVAGVVGLMGGAIRQRVAAREARRLLEGALEWLWAIRKDGLFPGGVQLSWSTGSLGIAAVMLAAADAARLPAWRRRALAIGRRLAAARGAEARVRDATLGNGAAGAAHMFHRMYRASGEELLAGAARLWIRRVISRRRPGAGMAGYRVHIGAWERRFLGRPDHPVGWIGLPGLVNGVAGIGLVLLSDVVGQEPAWDRALLLAYR